MEIVSSQQSLRSMSPRRLMRYIFNARAALKIPEDCTGDKDCTIGKCSDQSSGNGFALQVMTCQSDVSRPCNLMFTQIDSFFNYVQAALCVDAKLLCDSMSLLSKREKRNAERKLKRLRRRRLPLSNDSFLQLDFEYENEHETLLEETSKSLRKRKLMVDKLLKACTIP